jgi:hypothetical protein
MSNGPIAALELQPSEAHVLAAASRLLAAHVAAGRLTNETLEATMEQCVRQAIHMAIRIDRILQSDDEAVGLGARSPVG